PRVVQGRLCLLVADDEPRGVTVGQPDRVHRRVGAQLGEQRKGIVAIEVAPRATRFIEPRHAAHCSGWRRWRQTARRGVTSVADMSAKRESESRDGVPLTNLEEPLFDEASATKRELVDYLDAVSGRILPGLEPPP